MNSQAPAAEPPPVTVVECVQLQAVIPESALPHLEPLLWMLSPNGIEVADPMCLHGVDVGQGGVRVTWYVAPTEAAQAAATVQAAAAQLGVSTDVSAQDVQG